MTWTAWLLFCATETVLCFTPGPAVLAVVSLSLAGGAGAGFRASLGILTANALYFLLSATGVGAVLIASRDLFLVIKWGGAGYLVWLGLRMIFSRIPSPGLDRDTSTTRSFASGPYVDGIVTQGANPKALVFFTALLPQFITPSAPVTLQIGILGVTSILIELGVLSLYVTVCHGARNAIRRPGLAKSLHRIGGVLLIAAAIGLAGMRRGS